MVCTISIPWGGRGNKEGSQPAEGRLGSLKAPPRSWPHLIEHHPVGIDLRITLGVQHDGLESPEVGERDLGVLGAHVDLVYDLVGVKVALTRITHAIP